MRFTQVSLVNWRNFKSVEVALQGRAFLVGPNGSGKSNFLDVFRFLSDLTAVGGGFQDAIQRRGGVSILRFFGSQPLSDISIGVRIGDEEAANRWEYELVFNANEQQRPVIKRERVIHDSQVILERPNEDDAKDPERLTQTYLEQVNANLQFREIAFFFSSVQYRHIVPQLVREPDRSMGYTNDDPYGGNFLEQLVSTREQILNERMPRLLGALKIAVPDLTDLALGRDAKGIPHLRGKYKRWLSEGAWLDETLFSDGTLRLIGLLWAVMDGNGPLLLEEPELSLHPEVIRVIPQLFGRVQNRTGRQILISTHSPHLLTDEGIGLDEVILLRPMPEGTLVQSANLIEEARYLSPELDIAEIVIPLTRPEGVEQLPMLADDLR